MNAFCFDRACAWLLATQAVAWCSAGLLVATPDAEAAPPALRTVHEIPLALANEAAMRAVESCEKLGHRVSATVVGQGGQVRVTARGDGASPHTPDTSRRKAYTAFTTRNATSTVAENWRQNPALSNLVHVTDVLAVGGGLPVQVDGETVGAIGVSGSPSGAIDEQCGQLGIDRLMARVKSDVKPVE